MTSTIGGKKPIPSTTPAANPTAAAPSTATTTTPSTATTSEKPVANANADFGARAQGLANRVDDAVGGAQRTTGALAVRHGSGGPNGVINDKVVSMIAAGAVNGRAQLVHEHPFTSGNHIDFLIDGAQVFPRLFQDLQAAQKSINLSFYIFNDDKLGNELADILITKAKAGLEVNLSVDGIGSVQILGSPARAIIDRMEAAGVNIVRNHVFDATRATTMFKSPDHRKIVVVDGTIGYTGGMNIGDHYRDGYHDVMIRVAGPVVQQMQSEWAMGYAHGGGDLLKNVDGADALRAKLFPPESEKAEGSMRARVIQAIPGENEEIFRETLRLINDAEKSIRIENPYCTNPEVQEALTAAAKRGVDVEVILPGESDHSFSHLAARAAYPKMMEAGVRIYEYPGFNHDKVMVVDDSIVSVGSSNLDDVALRHIYEMNLVVENKPFARDIKRRLFDVDRAICKEMKAEEITTLQRVTGAFWGLFHDII